MARGRWLPPEAEVARAYRRARERWDRERVGRYGEGGFGGPGYRGAYAERPAYTLPRGELVPPGPEGSSWPHAVRELSPIAEERHLRALADRDLARSVVAALRQALGPAADDIAVYARDGGILLEGVVNGPRGRTAALATAWAVPGVRRVRDRLEVYPAPGRGMRGWRGWRGTPRRRWAG